MIAVVAIIRAALESLIRLTVGPEKMSPGGQKLKFSIFLNWNISIRESFGPFFAKQKGAEIPLTLRLFAFLGRGKEFLLLKIILRMRLGYRSF